MKTLTTEEIARACGGTTTSSVEVTSVVIDNREVTPGALFVAIRGERLDGHQFVNAAIAAGAAAVMVHEDGIVADVPVIKVEDTEKALLTLARFYRESFDIPLVALTGSVGKTTTKEMIWCVLNAKYNAHKTQGNLNNSIGVPKVLLRMEEDHTAAVIEMGMNHKGEISVLTRTALPNMAVITNIGVSHIENLGSREGILAAKLEILEGLKEGSALILNNDNDMLSKLCESDFDYKYRIRTFGIHSDADVMATDIVYSDASTRFVAVIKPSKLDGLDGADGCESKECSFVVVLPTTGEHNVYDALAAISVGAELGIEPQKMADALAGYVPAGMREKIEVVKGITLVEDCYNASPDSVRALSNTLRIKGEGGHRKIAVIADMLELGAYSEEGHRNCGKYLADAGVDLLLTYGKLAKFVADEAKKNGVLRVFEFDSKEELAKHLIPLLKEGDVVAFKGSRGMMLEEVIDLVKGELS
ncbi:MAG: UDP-N-acetylmuramoyl-tripeptide--D-alanyl-D-alanine ligase [Oscillospiraceae bacterium]|nr:UDP-N-acetylmuramoyl-tripeptide--D-alanyl-D-alanine ligase [Candidatus Limimonas egerieequi]